MKLDKIDLNIIRALQADGRMTKLRLAQAVNLSPAACWERLHRLEAIGIITGYGARIDVEKFARQTTCLVEVTLKSHQQVDFERFESAIMREPSIVACDATGGGIDYILRIVSQDIEAYQQLIDRLLSLDLRIDRYFTYVVTKSVKEAVDMPLPLLSR